MHVGERARELFASGLYCAESVLTALAEAGGKEQLIPPGLGTGFCSGMARTAGQCGAVSGAVMALGLYGGRIDPEESVDGCYSLVQEFLKRFHEQYGSSNCREMLGLDFRIKRDLVRFKNEERVKDCMDFSAFAADLAWEIIEAAMLADVE